uniref:Fe-ADH domain-containing protein n=1 Tax=Steinernema glaseri TaxID=37863 RepID=A0A1I8ANE3_9BILA
MERPGYQGANPISDVWAKEALLVISKYFRRAVNDPEDLEARSEMLKAASFAGMGFSNAGVHLCHALCYPISSQGKQFVDKDYNADKPLIPHGLSVVTTAVADFLFTTEADPQRHAQAARFLGCDISVSASSDYIAQTLADSIRSFMSDFSVPNGLSALGFNRSDVPGLADSAESSMKAYKLCLKEADKDVIAELYEKSLTVY